MENIESVMLAAGIALLITEALVGFTVIVLFTLGLTMIIMSGLVFAGVFTPTLLNLFLIGALLDSLLTVALWKPMKLLQADKQPVAVKNDLIGNQFTLSHDAGPDTKCIAEYSGVTWRIHSEQQLPAGTRVEIQQVVVGALVVKQKV